MDELITRFLQGTASSFEAQQLRRWREKSPENERYFREVAGVWDLTAPEPAPSAPPPPTLEEITGVTPFPRVGPRPVMRPGLSRWVVLAACLAALALGVTTLTHPGPTVLARHQAPEGMSRTVTLADGSYARLAPGSSLEELGADGLRQVRLRGRAFFAVVRDETRPFVVDGGAARVRVLGTRFEVSLDGSDGLRTLVVEGRVAVEGELGSVEIGPGEVAEVEEGTGPQVSRPDDIYSLLDWPNGFLVFQGTPLHQVAREVERNYGEVVEIASPELGDRRITAWFGAESFREVTEALCMVTGAECTPTGEGMRMGNPGGGEGLP